MRILFIFMFFYTFQGKAQIALDTGYYNRESRRIAAASIQRQQQYAAQKDIDEVRWPITRHINKIANRRYDLFALTDEEYSQFEKADSARKVYLPYLTAVGELDQRRIRWLFKEERRGIEKIFRQKHLLDSILQHWLMVDFGTRGDSSVFGYWKPEPVITQRCPDRKPLIGSGAEVFDRIFGGVALNEFNSDTLHSRKGLRVIYSCEECVIKCLYPNGELKWIRDLSELNCQAGTFWLKEHTTDPRFKHHQIFLQLYGRHACLLKLGNGRMKRIPW